MIRLANISCLLGGQVWALRDLNLEVPAGLCLALLGSSGSGKSTTLKIINGLIHPTRGEVFFENRPLDYDNIYSLRLKMGYCVQGAGLLPHMSVAQNISIMARMLGWKRETIAARVEELLDLVGLHPKKFSNKYPLALSGGEEQRVGFARALMLDPPILLMDEPFGALDPITRRQLQDDFLKLESILKKTVVLVTHDVAETFKLADQVAILHEGKLVQCDTPANIRARPINGFVEQFIQGI